MATNSTPNDLADGRSDSDLLAAISDGAGDVRLTSQERRLIANFRVLESIAQQFMVDMSEELVAALPASRLPLSRCWFVSGRPDSANGAQHP